MSCTIVVPLSLPDAVMEIGHPSDVLRSDQFV